MTENYWELPKDSERQAWNKTIRKTVVSSIVAICLSFGATTLLMDKYQPSLSQDELTQTRYTTIDDTTVPSNNDNSPQTPIQRDGVFYVTEVHRYGGQRDRTGRDIVVFQHLTYEENNRMLELINEHKYNFDNLESQPILIDVIEIYSSGEIVRIVDRDRFEVGDTYSGQLGIIGNSPDAHPRRLGARLI